MFVPPTVREWLRKLGLDPREPFSVCKQVREDQGEELVEWADKQQWRRAWSPAIHEQRSRKITRWPSRAPWTQRKYSRSTPKSLESWAARESLPQRTFAPLVFPCSSRPESVHGDEGIATDLQTRGVNSLVKRLWDCRR